MAGTSFGHAKQDQFAFYMDLVGHDILNSNQAALGYIELMLANPGCDSALRAYAEKAFSHVRRSTMLVENVMVPPSGMASRALTARFSTTCSS